MMGQLMLSQLKSFCFKPFPRIMLCFMSVMTFLNSQTLYFSSVCITFMLCFSQLGPQTCPAEHYEERQYTMSRYLLYFLLIHAALLWLMLMVKLGSFISPWQSGFTAETWLILGIAYSFDIIFISFAVPLSLSTDRELSRLVSIMLLIIICTFMLTLKSLMVYLLPLNLPQLCSSFLSMPWVTLLVSLTIFWRRSSRIDKQILAAHSEQSPSDLSADSL